MVTCATRRALAALLGLVALSWSAPGAAALQGDLVASAAIERFGEALQRRTSTPGLALAVEGPDGRILSEAWGFADLENRVPARPSTRWRVGSVSKSFTAAGAVLLAERAALDLDAPIYRYLPEWMDRPAGSATARQLAGHLGGIRHYREGEGLSYSRFEDVTEALEIFSADTLVARPGTEYEYSTYGYSLLSAVIQAAADRPFLSWMEAELFGPLGMVQTGPDLANRIIEDRAAFYEIEGGRLVPAPFTDNSYKWAGGGYLSTPEDMVRFGRALLQGRLLSPAAVDRMFTSQVTAGGETTGYGMGFRPRIDPRGARVVHHGGSAEGGRAFLALYPDEGLVIAFAANRSTAPLFAEEAYVVAHLTLEHGAAGSGSLDSTLEGGWSVEGTLTDDRVSGALHLHARGHTRGWLAWGEDRAPIEVILVDRHGTTLRLVGVGPHGAMTAELDPGPDDGWTGTWQYLGQRGALELRPLG